MGNSELSCTQECINNNYQQITTLLLLLNHSVPVLHDNQ